MLDTLLRRIKIVIEYDGTNYHGWQVQDNAHTVEAELESAVFRITGEKTRVIGSGRTDAGVHALGQVAHFDTHSKIPGEKFRDALSGVLPADIAVLSSEEVDLDFHARFSALRKTYEYRILNRRIRSPLLEKRAWHIREELEFDYLRKAALRFIGTYDFSAFCASGRTIYDFERTVYSSEWIEKGDLLIYRVCGNGFLYKMVRIMVGTMAEIGLGKRSPDSITEIISGRDRNSAGITAPAHGLYLVRVHYGDK